MGCRHWDRYGHASHSHSHAQKSTCHAYTHSADRYNDSEDLLGKWFKRTGKRNDIFLATKFGFTSEGLRGDAAYVKEAAERSLSRLGVETIDLYYAHRYVWCIFTVCSVMFDVGSTGRVDPKTPIEETVGAMAELVK